jgi:uncharacterized protein YigE (DUF2233 family)
MEWARKSRGAKASTAMGTLRRRLRHVAALSACFAAGFSAADATAWAACAAKSFDSAKFTVCTFDPAHDDIRLFLSGPDNKPYGSLAALAGALTAKGETLVFAMNAGMFKSASTSRTGASSMRPTLVAARPTST